MVGREKPHFLLLAITAGRLVINKELSNKMVKIDT